MRALGCPTIFNNSFNFAFSKPKVLCTNTQTNRWNHSWQPEQTFTGTLHISVSSDYITKKFRSIIYSCWNNARFAPLHQWDRYLPSTNVYTRYPDSIHSTGLQHDSDQEHVTDLTRTWVYCHDNHKNKSGNIYTYLLFWLPHTSSLLRNVFVRFCL